MRSTLRTTTAHQITGLCADNTGGRCAVGVIAEAFGCDPTDPCTDPYEYIQRYGIRYAPIYRMNDFHHHTFAQIADYLETLPVTDPVPDTVPWNTLVEVG